MSKMVNLNKNASALIGTSAKVRVRVLGGMLQILPTNRVKSINLPKGEMLAELKVRADRGTVRFQMPAVADLNELDGAEGAKFNIVQGKHGWLTMVNVTEAAELLKTPIGQAAPAGASITAK